MAAGLYRSVLAKAGDQKLRTKPITTETKTLSAASQEGQDYEIPNMGDLVALQLDLTVTSVGTLSSPTKASAVLNQIKLVDKAGTGILENIAGSDLNYLGYLNNGAGTKITETDNATSAVTDHFLVPMTVDSAKLPARLRISYNAYSSLASSGATGGSTSLTITAFYRDGSTDVTMRIKKNPVSLISGINSLNSLIPRGVVMNFIGLKAAETTLTKVVLSSDGSAELDITLAVLQQYLDSARSAAHITNYLLVPCSPFITTDRSAFEVTTSNTDATAAVYFFTLD